MLNGFASAPTIHDEARGAKPTAERTEHNWTELPRLSRSPAALDQQEMSDSFPTGL